MIIRLMSPECEACRKRYHIAIQEPDGVEEVRFEFICPECNTVNGPWFYRPATWGIST